MTMQATNLRPRLTLPVGERDHVQGPATAAVALVVAIVAPSVRAEDNKAPEGFTLLFNGKDLTGWQIHNGKLASWGADKGVLFVKGGGGGWLMTEKEYGDFELRLEFKVPVNGNSGVAVHSPREGDPAYSGMEIQILDDPAPQYKNIQPWQKTGSIYAELGYRALSFDYDHDGLTYDTITHGAQVTVGIQF